jgi:type I restriction enzyme M protein
VFRPYAGVSTAILLFTKTNSGGTKHVWFYDMQADGYSLDDKRNPLLPEDRLGPSTKDKNDRPIELKLSADEQAKNNFPDILRRWQHRNAEAKRARTEQSFLVPKAEIAGNDYDLSINRYKQMVHAQVHYDPPQKILAELKALEAEIMRGVKELEGML